MIGSSTESKNWQAARQAWDALQRRGILVGKTMPVLTFEREVPGAAASARRDGRVDSVNLTARTARLLMGDPGNARFPRSAYPHEKTSHLGTLLHEFAHTAQPGRRANRSEIEGGAEAFKQLLATTINRELGRGPFTQPHASSAQYER